MSQPIGPDLVYHLTGVSSPSMSPDGTRLAFVRSHVDREAMESRSQVMMMSLPDGSPREFTRGPKDGSPRFSPDGSTLAFLRPDRKEQRQIWLMPLSGGEPCQLTSQIGGVIEFSWSPDSHRIAYVAEVDPDRPPPDHDPKKNPRVKVVRRIWHRIDTIGFRGDAHKHIFVVDAGDGATCQLTDGDWDDFAPLWSPDGSRIAFISDRRPDRDTIYAQSQVYVVPAVGGEPTLWSANITSVGALGWSPDGRRLVTAATSVPRANVWMQSWLYLLEQGKQPLCLTDDSIKPAAGFPPLTTGPVLCWREDGQIMFAADSRGQSWLFTLPAGGGSPQRVAGGDMQITDVCVDAGGRYAAIVAATPRSPGDLYLVDVATTNIARLTDYNGAFLQAHTPGHMEKFSIRRGGLEIECRLILPPGFDSASRYPLVLDIHGGPHSVFADAFNPLQQVLATAGYIVLAVNPGGSSTYGNDFVMRVIRDWGGEDYQDLMAAVDEMAARPYVDPSRMGVHGYSYGGYMSSWIAGHTDRFKAAVVGAPVIDLPSMYGTSDIGVGFGEMEWGGLPQDARDAFIERSPLTYAPNVKTPVLLLHGEADLRCPISQSEQYFVALKRLGKEVEFVRFPDCNHLFTRTGHPRMQEEYFRRTLEWFDRYLKR